MSIFDELKVYARRTALEARRHADRARELKATDPMANIGGADESIAQMYRDQHRAEIEREEKQAKLKSDRARAAEGDVMLRRYPEELLDDDFMYQHQSLLLAAEKAGLVTDSVD